jgi:hypothetical protein
LGSGDYFGEMAFLATCRRFFKNEDANITDTDVMRTADIIATSTCRMMEFSVRNFLAILRDDLEGGRGVLESLSETATERKQNLMRIAEERRIAEEQTTGHERQEGRAPSKHRPRAGSFQKLEDESLVPQAGLPKSIRQVGSHALKPSRRLSRDATSPYHVVLASSDKRREIDILDTPAAHRLEVMDALIELADHQGATSVD